MYSPYSSFLSKHLDMSNKYSNFAGDNLDMIISVGYRVNSIRATQFRRWATF